MVDVENIATLMKGVTALTLNEEPARDLGFWLAEQTKLVVTVTAGRPRTPTRKPWAWLQVEALDELGWSRLIKTAHVMSDHLEGSIGLFQLSNVTDLVIHVSGERFDDRNIELFRNEITNLASGNLARLQILVEEPALEFSRETLKWPGLDTRIDTVPSRPRPKR